MTHGTPLVCRKCAQEVSFADTRPLTIKAGKGWAFSTCVCNQCMDAALAKLETFGGSDTERQHNISAGRIQR